MKLRISQAAYVLFIALCFAPLMPLPTEVLSWFAPGSLVCGMALALTLGNPFAERTKKASKFLLQASVVLLGFSMEFAKVAKAGKDGLLFSLVSISLVFFAGWLIGRVLKVRSIVGLLVSAGTAICGGSAIAAVSSVVDAPSEDVSVSVGAVFLLNAIALLIFPPLGHMLGLSQHQFGLWSGISVHDIASVVGAGNAYGPEALEMGTAVKLSRVLYLVPVTLIIAWIYSRRGASSGKKVAIPWFIGLFLLASLLRSYAPGIAPLAPEIKRIATVGFSICLFMIGSSLTVKTLKAVGVRPLVLGVALWALISVTSLVVVW